MPEAPHTKKRGKPCRSTCRNISYAKVTTIGLRPTTQQIHVTQKYSLTYASSVNSAEKKTHGGDACGQSVQFWRCCMRVGDKVSAGVRQEAPKVRWYVRVPWSPSKNLRQSKNSLPCNKQGPLNCHRVHTRFATDTKNETKAEISVFTSRIHPHRELKKKNRPF